MNRTQRTLGALAALPLLLAPLGCEKAGDAVNAASDSAKNAAGAVGDAIGDMSNWTKDKFADGLGDLQPKISEAIDKLKAGGGNLTEGMKEKLQKLTDINIELPEVIKNLKEGTGDVLSGAMEKAKSLMAEIPKLLASLKGE